MSIYREPIDISIEQWMELLQDGNVFRDDDIILIKTLYDCKGCRERASILATILGIPRYTVLNLQVGRLGKRIINKLPDIKIPRRKSGEIRYWHIPFWAEAAKLPGQFYWELRPELKYAFKQLLDMHIATMDGLFKNIPIAEEVLEEEAGNLFEGAKRQIVVNAYERSPKARKACIKHFGTKCLICGFDFGEFYGDKFRNIVQVHHIKPLREINAGYIVNPKRDLIPVCPNCHAALHSRIPPYTPEEMRECLSNK